ncbi:hypothetical protein MMC16_001713 [Acarospora aff. strigata]|nr:hypothetical protein [Acarospora aff. strigata]
MFAAILPSRPVLTSLTTISPTQFALTFPSTPSFSHIVVFLLPGNLLPPETVAAVYIRFPGSAEFRLLGAIGNEKQSAIFRVGGGNGNGNGGMGGGGGGVLGGESAEDGDVMVDESPTTATTLNGTGTDTGTGTDAILPPGAGAVVPPGDVDLGISIEPTRQILASLQALQSLQSPASQPPSSSSTTLTIHPAPSPISTKPLAQRIIKNAFNFLASFADADQAGCEVVPLRAFREWWAKFERRIEADPGFLERDEEG